MMSMILGFFESKEQIFLRNVHAAWPSHYESKTSVVDALILIIILCLQLPCLATLNMRGQSAYLRVAAGANLVINQPINNFSGKLIRDQGGTISGSTSNTITFSRGLFEDAGNDILLYGILDLPSTTSQIQLTGASSGNNLLRAQPGVVYQNVWVSGNGNRIEGSPIMTQNITLNDVNTTVTIAMQTPLNSTVILNNGTVNLEADLTFAASKSFQGAGTINGNNEKIIFGASPLTFSNNLIFQNVAELQLWNKIILNSAMTFAGTSLINGNGNIIQFNAGGQIYITSGSTLYLTDAVLQNFGNNSFVFADNTGQIIMSNVAIELSQNVTTTIGTIYVNGATSWILRGYNWNFSTVSTLTVDDITMWGDNAGSKVRGTITCGPSNLSLLNTATIKLG